MILSNLIVKQWFKSLIAAITVLFLLISTADLINGFLQGKDAMRVLLEYSLKMPDLMGRMFPICCLVATLFSLNNLKSHAELIAILAAGYSYRRIYFLVGACALTMVGLQFLNLGFVEPFANKVKRQEIQKSRKSEGKYLTRSSIEGGRFWYKSQNYFASFGFFDRKSNVLQDVEIYFFSEAHTSTKILKAQKASFISEGKWLLTNVIELSGLSTPTFPMQTTKPELTMALNETPDDFGEFEADLTTLNFFKLNQFINRMSKTGINVSEYQIILMNKVFLSFVCLVFALIPVSTIFNPNRRSDSFGKNVVLTLLVTVLFWVLYSGAVAYGNSGAVAPWLATGIVPILFFSYVVFTYWKHRKLSI
ncbi:LptF/LptG family permease [Peredibacter sp. HCB2-198]|uniref:LptF/LptG family permease n=1 Tax=Peredibacter sp. HCB2-198 TaxID=3383025 RepID=UPI0038B42FC5